MKPKYIFLRQKLNEAVSEIASDYETFDDFKRGASNPKNNSFFVYSQVDKSAIPNLQINGADGAKEFMNIDHMYYGRGIYTTMSYDYCQRYNEGDAVVKYLVKKGAFDNFLIFDMGIRKMLYKSGILTKHEKISQTCRRCFNKDTFSLLEKYYGKNLYILDEKVAKCDNNSDSWDIESRFWDILKGSRDLQLRPGTSKYHNELALDTSEIDGFAYWASLYGPVAIFRTTDLLMPYSYGYRMGYGYRDKFPEEKDLKYCISDENAFNNSNHIVDSFKRSRKDYPDTSFTEKTTCGFSVVRRGNKYNLLSSRTHKLLSPLDFDGCSAFDPFTNKTTCVVNTEEDGTIEFEFTSINYGKEVKIRYRQIAENEKSPWEDISYTDFIAAMEEFKAEAEGVSLNEAVSEVFTHKDYNSFKRSIKKPGSVFVYRATSPQTAKIEFENGSNREFSGTSGDASLYYGLGVYCVNDTNSLYCRKYGDGVVKFMLKDGYKDFIIFDNELRAKYDPGKTVYDEICELVPKELFDTINKELANNNRIYSDIKNDLQNKGLRAMKHIKDIDDYHRSLGKIKNTAKYAKAFIETLLGRRLGDPVAPAVRDEKLLSKTNIRGMVFVGSDDGNVVLVRDFNSLMPVDYSVDGGRSWMVETGRAEFSEKNFNNINTNVDPYFLYRNEYEDISFRAHPSADFSLVKGKQGYNWKDIWFHRPLLPIDVDSATDFDPFGRSAGFAIGDYHFNVTVDDDLNCQVKFKDDDGWEDMPYDYFMECIEAMKEQGIIAPNKTVYTNSLLNPETKRNK